MVLVLQLMAAMLLFCSTTIFATLPIKIATDAVPFCVNRTDGCSGHGDCIKTGGTQTCKCDIGFSGSHCNVEPECKNCSKGTGPCIDKFDACSQYISDTNVCSCGTWYCDGSKDNRKPGCCGQACPITRCPLDCKHGSLPNSNSSDCTICNIHCPPGWSGQLCDTWNGNSSDANKTLFLIDDIAKRQRAAMSAATGDPTKRYMCELGRECPGWGETWAGEPSQLTCLDFTYSNPANQYNGILMPDGVNWTAVPSPTPIFSEPSGTHAFVDVRQFVALKEQRRVQNKIHRGVHSYTLGIDAAFDSLFNSKSDDRMPTITQASVPVVSMTVTGTPSLNRFTMQALNALPPTYKDGPAIWEKFFSYWGISVIDDCVMGGYIEAQGFTQTYHLQTGDFTTSTLEEEAKAQFAVDTGLTVPGAQGKPSSAYTAATQTSISCVGGNPSMCPASSPSSTQAWIKSVSLNPILSQYGSQMLSKYVTDVELQNNFNQAVTDSIAAANAVWSGKNKCPTTCSTASGVNGTCDTKSTNQYACACPCHLGRMCQGPGLCMKGCCDGKPTGGGCGYHFDLEENMNTKDTQRTGPVPNGDGSWSCDVNNDIPAKGSCSASCDADLWGMHCDCGAHAALPPGTHVVKSSGSGSDPESISSSGLWNVHMGCGGSCTASSSVSFDVSMPNSGTTCTYPTMCKAAARPLKTRSDYDRQIEQLQSQSKVLESHKLAQEAVEKGVYDNMWQRPSSAYVPGVQSSPFPAVSDSLPYVSVLHQPGAHQTIKEETAAFDALYSAASDKSAFKNVVSSGHPTLPTLPNGKHNDFWGQVLLMTREGNFTHDALAHFKGTVRLLQQVMKASAPDIIGMPPGGVTIARIPAGGVRIKPHCGVTNARLRVSFGVKIPKPSFAHGEPACAIRVANETKTWTEGKSIVLDDSYEHEAWNLSPEDRIILLADFWHPNITHAQRVRLENGLYTHDVKASDMLFNGSTFERLQCTRCKSSVGLWAGK